MDLNQGSAVAAETALLDACATQAPASAAKFLADCIAAGFSAISSHG